MKQKAIIRSLKEAAPEFAELEWLREVVLFGPALREDPVDSDIDLLLVADRTLSAQEKDHATKRLRHRLEDRVGQPLDLRITTARAMDSPRGQLVGYGRILEGDTVSVFRRGT